MSSEDISEPSNSRTLNKMVSPGSQVTLSQLLPPPPVGPLPLDPGSLDPTTGSSAAAIARSAASSMAFIFKRPPLRFFRPVKISTYGALQAMAEERGRPVSLKFVQSVIKREGPWKFNLNHTLPPFCFNTIIGLTLFTTYTTIETHLLEPEPHLHPYLVPALAGSAAGAAQSLISAPLDNLRLLQVSQPNLAVGSSTKVQFKGWIPLLKQVMLPLSFNTRFNPNFTDSERFKLWASRGWGMIGLSVFKDSLGFATFFTIFQIGRDLGKRLANSVDRSLHIVGTGSENDAEGFVGERGWTGRILQSCVIVLSGATAGWAYGIVAEPFEALRRALWKARLDWASIHLKNVQTDKINLGRKSSSHSNQHPLHHRYSSFTNFKGIRLSHYLRSKGKTTPPSSNSKDQPKLKTQKEQPPSISKILKNNFTKKRQQGFKSFNDLYISMINNRAKIKVPDSISTNAMRFDPTVHPCSHSKPSSPRNPLSRVTRFRSFILSPYSIGFFVWAICSGDLSV
ncbi:hypothetical protein PSTG_06901 [Puccinia striiformis f. sp. tritici PST-78]|uniref:Mitochondrial carrier protein n=1 Tax=Puccinia striiformis f. sp. tritici PST-78 TaxID=1165861 RepID=A0A0L0VKK4_9BASI|nr:hypothetical protein PSTG_06901 [Puccinia striiformis f. sp. tritici PST-78]